MVVVGTRRNRGKLTELWKGRRWREEAEAEGRVMAEVAGQRHGEQAVGDGQRHGEQQQSRGVRNSAKVIFGGGR